MRVIASVQIREDSAVKTTRFENPRYIGDPLNIVRLLNEKGAQEIAIIDIGASLGKALNYSLIKQIAEEIKVPMAYGGGLSKTSDIKKLTALGIERFIVNTSFFNDLEFLRNLGKTVGRSSMSFSLDITSIYSKEVIEVSYSGGSLRQKINLSQLFLTLDEIGVSEIIIRIIELDGGDGSTSVNRYNDLLSLPAFNQYKYNFIFLIGSGVRNIDIARELFSHEIIDGFVVGSMVCYAKKSDGILITYPTNFSILH